MTEHELKNEIDKVTFYYEELIAKIKQLEEENRMTSTSKSQYEVNKYLIERCQNMVKVLEKRKRYLLLCLDNPQPDKYNLYDALTLFTTSFRCTPRSIL
jgi:hypothetical protein